MFQISTREQVLETKPKYLKAGNKVTVHFDDGETEYEIVSCKTINDKKLYILFRNWHCATLMISHEMIIKANGKIISVDLTVKDQTVKNGAFGMYYEVAETTTKEVTRDVKPGDVCYGYIDDEGQNITVKYASPSFLVIEDERHKEYVITEGEFKNNITSTGEVFDAWDLKYNS